MWAFICFIVAAVCFLFASLDDALSIGGTTFGLFYLGLMFASLGLAFLARNDWKR